MLFGPSGLELLPFTTETHRTEISYPAENGETLAYLLNNHDEVVIVIIRSLTIAAQIRRLHPG